ncbi:hypothetical protein TWF192_001082 [Orbilia oligospora]|uniref:Uncharacterized protein n=1 Tax=Orbilia oligospora TaxID=2813651 RepID=A0A6G1LUV7_ORBOL|nr:hypothetical protein TWF191_001533 [Orbilia oligospora]KAF3210866.1 hypothetical protein TWF679_006654 [Orbilia oligospora]KAF3235115.1 hypothetical protein TWF192_001082 [Orbilia oligospora]
MAPLAMSEYSVSEKSTDGGHHHPHHYHQQQQQQPQITTAQLNSLIDKFCPYATEVAQRIRKASKEGLVVPQELVNIPEATTKLVGFLKNLRPAAGYFKPEFTEALYLRVLGMQRDYQGLSHNVDIWLSGQRAKKIVRFKPVNGNRLPPPQAYRHPHAHTHGHGHGDRDREYNPYVVSMVGPKALL